MEKKCGKNGRKGYDDVFEINEDGKFMCPYNCPDAYANEKGLRVAQHIKARHDTNFNLQTFNGEKADLNVYIPRKKKVRGAKRYSDVFEKNKYGEYKCPYSCPDKYVHKDGNIVRNHIRRRHDPDFNLQTFNPDEDNLNSWIPLKCRTGRKRKRRKHDEKSQRKKKRKLKI